MVAFAGPERPRTRGRMEPPQRTAFTDNDFYNQLSAMTGVGEK